MPNLMKVGSQLAEEVKKRPARGELPGPRPFWESEALGFRGRSHEAAILADMVCARSGSVLQGPPGRGKSSLVRAGLLPLLRERGCRVLPVARVTGPRPLAGGALGNAFAAHVMAWWGSPGATDLATALKAHKWDGRSATPTPLVAVFDPFDDFFTAPKTTDRERRQFFGQLAGALAADRLLRILFVTRDEFVGQVVQFADDADLPERVEARLRLNRLSIDDASRVVTAALAPIEEGVADLLAVRLTGGDGETSLPTDSDPHGPLSVPLLEPQLVQLACCSLTAGRRPTERITYKQAEQFCSERSGWDANHYLEHLYESALRDAASGTDVPDERLRHLFSELAIAPAVAIDNEWEELRLKELAHAHPPLVVDTTPVDGEVARLPGWYELAHETLGPAIQSANAKWEKQRQGRDSGRRASAERYLAEIEKQAADYKAKGSSALLSETQLIVAEAWRDSLEVRELKLLSDPVRQLIEQSRLAVAALALAKTTRQKRLWAAAAVVGFLLFTGAAILAWLASSRGAQVVYANDLLKGQQEVIAALNDVANDPRESARKARNRLVDFEANYPKQSSDEDVRSQRDVLHRSIITWLNLAMQADRTHAELKNGGQNGEVNGVAFGGADGRLVATACEDGGIRIWRLNDDGQPIDTPMVLDDGGDHPPLPAATAVAFRDKDTWLASAHEEGVVVVWKLSPDGKSLEWSNRLRIDDREIDKLPKEFQSSGVAWSSEPEHRILAAAGSWKNGSDTKEGTGLRVWEFDENGKERPLRSPDSANRRTTALAFCPSPVSRLITAHSDGLRYWTIKTDEVQRTPKRTWPKFLADIPVAAGTSKLAVGKIRLLTSSPSDPIAKSDVRLIVAAACADNSARLWDVETGKAILKIRHPDAVRGVAFHPLGYQLATAGRDGRARVWRMIGVRWPEDQNTEWTEWAFTGREAQTLVGHTRILTDVAYGPMRSGNRPPLLASASDDGTARLWDVGAMKGPSCILGLAECTGFAFGPDLRWVACCDPLGNRREPLLLPLSTNLAPLPNQATTELERWANRKNFESKPPTVCVAFAPDSRQIATLDRRGKLRLWPLWGDAPLTGDVVSFWQFLGLQIDPLFCHVSYSGDGSRVAMSVNRGTVGVFPTTCAPDAMSKLVPLLQLSEGDLKIPVASTAGAEAKFEYRASTYGVALDLSGEQLALGCQGEVRVWNVPSPANPSDLGKEFGRFKVPGKKDSGGNSDVRCNGVQFSADGTCVAAGCGDGRVRIWNLRDSSKPLWQSPLKDSRGSLGHSSEVQRVAFDPNHLGRIASGDSDGLVCVWDWLQPNGQIVPEDKCRPIYQLADTGPIEALAFDTNGHRLAIATAAGHVRIYVLDETELKAAAQARLGEPKK